MCCSLVMSNISHGSVFCCIFIWSSLSPYYEITARNLKVLPFPLSPSFKSSSSSPPPCGCVSLFLCGYSPSVCVCARVCVFLSVWLSLCLSFSVSVWCKCLSRLQLILLFECVNCVRHTHFESLTCLATHVPDISLFHEERHI